VGGAVVLWDAATGKKLAPTLLADTAKVTDVAFDGTIKLWFTAGLRQEGAAAAVRR
jgi:hypothetical protein